MRFDRLFLWTLSLSFGVISSVPLASAEFKVVKAGDSGRFFIQDSNCLTLRRKADSLAGLQPSSQPNSNPTAYECKEVSSGVYSVEITSLCPPEVKEMLVTCKPERGTANCFNTALYFAKIIPAIRHVTSHEFSYWIKSPLCKELSKEEDLQPGDIGVKGIQFAEGSWGYQHAFIHIDDDFTFEKHGPRADWQLGTLTTSLKDFHPGGPELAEAVERVKAEHPELFALKPEQTEHLSPEEKADLFKKQQLALGSVRRITTSRAEVYPASFFNYFRCQSIEQYFNNNRPSQLALLSHQKVQGIECSVGNHIQGRLILQPEQIDSLFDGFNLLERIATLKSSAEGVDEPDRLVWKGILSKIESLRRGSL